MHFLNARLPLSGLHGYFKRSWVRLLRTKRSDTSSVSHNVINTSLTRLLNNVAAFCLLFSKSSNLHWCLEPWIYVHCMTQNPHMGFRVYSQQLSITLLQAFTNIWKAGVISRYHDPPHFVIMALAQHISGNVWLFLIYSTIVRSRMLLRTSEWA